MLIDFAIWYYGKAEVLHLMLSFSSMMPLVMCCTCT